MVGHRKRFISRMVRHFITNCRISVDETLEEPLLKYRAKRLDGPARFLRALKEAVSKRVIQSASVQHLEFKGQGMVVAVFEALSSDPERLLPEATLVRWKSNKDQSRVICDHIAGMIDSFLLKTYERLFSPRMGSVFDRI